ncbi:773a3147-0539-43cc-80ca-244493130790 [Thermothielavioides terrestris]|uniref:773a3147-0539-43cc-80ca-244493130790 n=1 Tax=Thermothielavioides terrestris TaxID=2587410 RepID=A0A446BYM7_9PEZI|nr:773a3147-0539-43cc-80ca-244493130790 [Thermothielavioides terrestris]
MADTEYADWSRDQLGTLQTFFILNSIPIPILNHRPLPLPPSSSTPTATGLAVTSTTSGGKKQAKKSAKKKPGRLDPSKYATRLVALKLAYLGRRYGGFEHQPGSAVPTVEEELWRALVRTCLIWPEQPDKVDFGPWEYSKCGRTDRGVSAFGQVIAIRLRSNRPLDAAGKKGGDDKGKEGEAGDVEMGERGEAGEMAGAADGGAKPAWDPIADEINYPRVLNRLLPPDIRVLAWAPTLPPGFSARFSCWERQYRYFFTQPAFTPLPASLDPDGTRGREGWLDIDAMRRAAKLFEGVHDFRNFCKVDGAKQITTFKRRVFEADVVEVEGTGSALPYLALPDFRPEKLAEQGGTHPKVYYFHVRGSAFLWHQIRHMVAILFLVGQGLEKPSIITDLLDVEKNPRKPNYTLAAEAPLVLWDCIFPKVDDAMRKRAAQEVHDPAAEAQADLKDGIEWVWVGEDEPSHLHGPHGLVDQLWECWRERKIDELLAQQLLDSVARKADLSRRLAELGGPPSISQRVFDGGDSTKTVGTYVPVLRKPLLATPEEVNDKWAQSKGFASAAEMLKTKNWRRVIKANKNGGGDDGTGSVVDDTESIDE